MLWKRQAALVCLIVTLSLWGCGGGSSGDPDTGTVTPDDTGPSDLFDTMTLDAPEVDAAPPSKFAWDWSIVNGETEGCGEYFAGTKESILSVTADFIVDGKYEGLEGVKRITLGVRVGNELKDAEFLSPPDGPVAPWVALNIDGNIENFLLNEDGEVLDGKLPFYLKFELKQDFQGQDELVKYLNLTLDSTAPSLTCTETPCEEETHVKVIGEVEFVLKIDDKAPSGEEGSGVKEIYFLLDGELFGEVIENPSLTPFPTVKLDFSAEPTGSKELEIRVTDCVGNETVRKVPLDIIAVPYFELPPTQLPPDNFGNVNRLRLVEPSEASSDNFESLSANDLILIGSGGVAAAQVDEDGVSGPFKILWNASQLAVLDAHVVDVTGDGLRDIVALALSPTSRNVVIIRQIANIIEVTVEDENGDEFTETVLNTDWELAQSIDLMHSDGVTPNLDIAILRVAHLNDDDEDGMVGSKNDRPDIVLASPVQQHSAQLYLHNNAYSPEPPEEGEDPEPQPEYFKPPLTLTGVVGIADVQVGFVNTDPYPDLVFGRSSSNMVTTVLLNDKGEFNSIPLNSPVFNGSGTDILLLADLYDGDNIADVVVTNMAQRAVYFLKGKSNGYIEALLPFVGQEMHDFGLEHVSNMLQDRMLDDSTTDDDPNQLSDIVMLGGEPHSMVVAEFSGDGIIDLAAVMPELNQIAIYTRAFDSMREGIFVSPGKNPRSLVAADFNGDGVDDMACLLSEPERVAIILNENVNQFAGAQFTTPRFKAPLEVPMPVGSNWTSGRVVPTHFAVEDLDSDGLMDIVVATQPEKMLIPPKEGGTDGEPQWTETKSLPLILTFLSDYDPNGDPFPVVPVIKSPVSPDFDQAFSGFVVGNFDGVDNFPDIAVTVAKTGKSICDGRTFDILRGGYQPLSVVYDKVPEGEDPPDKYTDGFALDYFNFDYNEFETINYPAGGHFWALGGYLGLQAPAGLAAGPLDSDDDLDDILLFAGKNGSDNPDQYQWAQAAAYLTRYDTEWVSSPNGAFKCQAYPQVWYDKAPYWPTIQTGSVCSDTDAILAEPGDVCIPLTGYEEYSIGIDSMVDPPTLIDASAEPAAFTAPLDVGEKPIAAVIADFDPASECMDILLGNSTDGDVTYIRGTCSPDKYHFYKDGTYKPQRFPVAGAVLDVKAGDINGDGWVDGIIATPDNVAILYGVDGKVFYDAEYLVKTGQPPITPSAVAVEDMNDDQMLDIIVTSTSHNEIVIYINAGKDENKTPLPGDPVVTVFTEPFRIPTGKEPIAVTSRDIDNDGCFDLAVLNMGTRSVTLLRSLRCETVEE